MTGLFENAKFGTLCQTRDGGNAVYICYVPYDKVHKVFIEGFERPLMFHDDGKRRGGGHANKYGPALDIVKILN